MDINSTGAGIGFGQYSCTNYYQRPLVDDGLRNAYSMNVDHGDSIDQIAGLFDHFYQIPPQKI